MRDVERSVRKVGMLLGFLLVAGPAGAAGYIKLGDIKGEAADKDHKEWIDVLSFSSAVGSYDASGRLASRTQSGTANRGTLTIQKTSDKASPKLLEACTKGEHIPSAELEVCGADGQCTRYVLNDVVIERYSVTRAGEEVTLAYSRIDWGPAAASQTIAAPASPARQR
jgi:type VI secretion system secreted protein Hcp